MPVKNWNNYLKKFCDKKVADPHWIPKELKKHHRDRTPSLCWSTADETHKSKLEEAVAEWDNIFTSFDRRKDKEARKEDQERQRQQAAADRARASGLRDREVFEISRTEWAKKRAGADLTLVFDKVQKVLNETVKNQSDFVNFLMTLSEPAQARPQRSRLNRLKKEIKKLNMKNTMMSDELKLLQEERGQRMKKVVWSTQPMAVIQPLLKVQYKQRHCLQQFSDMQYSQNWVSSMFRK